MANILDLLDERTGNPAEWAELASTTQGHILEKHRRPFVWNLLLRFNDAAAARAVVASLAPQIASAQDLRNRHAATREGRSSVPAYFFGLSAAGCRALGIDDGQFGLDFQQGFYTRTRDSLHVSNLDWQTDWSSQYHGLMVCVGEGEDDLRTLVKDLAGSFGSRVAIARTEKCARMPLAGGDATEHFGFADGISQPLLPHDADCPRNPSYSPRIPLSRVLIEDPLARRHYGSFMAYLRIQQHVDQFDNAASALATKVTPPAGRTALEHAGALIIGRYSDGQPLIPGRACRNDFQRADDPHGTVWPFASHISKMNSRNGVASDFRPIIRRGIPYDEAGEKGLVFQSFQSDLSGQFEVLLNTWANDVHHPALSCGRDPTITNGEDTQDFPTNDRSRFCVSGLTSIRGGEYFYFPSKPGLQALAI